MSILNEIKKRVSRKKKAAPLVSIEKQWAIKRNHAKMCMAEMIGLINYLIGEAILTQDEISQLRSTQASISRIAVDWPQQNKRSKDVFIALYAVKGCKISKEKEI